MSIPYSLGIVYVYLLPSTAVTPALCSTVSLVLQSSLTAGAGGVFQQRLTGLWGCASVAVQVKCLNPSLLVPDGGMGSVTKVQGCSCCDQCSTNSA